ncbi:MAG: hypoxanthine phosphoribosyltransferase [Parabacteroides distasonis]|nr:hypoxanthine phosphoribosyltransferase [Parabacteroides distasonis]
MKTVQVKDRQFSLYISENKIKEQVKKIAGQINTDLNGKNPLLLVILNGAFVFAADLLRDVTIPCEVSFIRLASYEGTSSTGEVKQLIGLNEDIEGRTVVIVEDIIDSGLTMQELLLILAKKNPKEIRIASLFVKPENLKVDLDIHYRCFDIDNDFIVGYGLDYDQEGRNLPDIYKVIE